MNRRIINCGFVKTKCVVIKPTGPPELCIRRDVKVEQQISGEVHHQGKCLVTFLFFTVFTPANRMCLGNRVLG